MRKIRNSIFGALVALIVLLAMCAAGLLLIPQTSQTAQAASANQLRYYENYSGKGYGVGVVDGSDVVGDLVIPDTYNGKPILEISVDAFRNRENLTSITIPSTVTSIPYQGFDNCANLKKVTATGVEFVNWWGFRNCPKLETVEMPKLKSVGDFGFMNCNALTNINLESLEKVTENGFHNCNALNNITLTTKLQSIGKYAFYSCNSLTEVNFKGTKAQWERVSKGKDYFKSTVKINFN